ncbi:hypothetical protein MBLNU459_g8253t1 [Dothideomycetes sp. NU459]
MSWSFANAPPAGSNPGVQVSGGPDLEDISTETLGFLAIAGETKLQLAQPWPSDRLPPTTASLFSVASHIGLVAAAGPENMVIATTESVRRAYHADVSAAANVKSFAPQATISIPRVNQLAFSSDESSLVIAAEQGGGLAVYDVQALQQGNQQSAFQMATNGTSVRALVPNPAPDASHLFAVLLADGKLMLADLKARQLVNGINGQVFREGVSCVAWSAKGKQLVAGLEDGTAAQYDPQGNIKAQIPRLPQVSGDVPLTAIYWVANDDFLTVHTPRAADNSDSIYHMLHRDKPSGAFSSQKFLGDPCPAFGLRSPANHFVSRLRAFPPALDDMLIFSSTAAIDLGVVTKSSTPLANDMPLEKIVNTYTTTGMANDSRRAQMPMSSDGMGDTSPIGMALDFSAKEMVQKPIPSDDIDETSTPLPALMLLNNEGVLSTWWIVYNDSIRQKTAYPGLCSVAAGSTPSMQSTGFANTTAAAASSTPPAFGATATPQTQPAFGQSSFGKPAAPAFGTPSAFGKPSQPAFGSASIPGFGGASALGSKSLWGTPAPSNSPSQNASSGFGKPAFGSSTPLASSSGNSGFGAVGGLGNKGSPWGAPQSSQQSSGSTFGQASAFGGGSASAASGFAKLASPGSASAFATPSNENKSNPSPFASFAAKQPSSPFASLTGTTAGDATKPTPPAFAGFSGNDANKPSPFASFGKPSDPAQPSFGSTVTLPSSTGASFGSAATFGAKTSPWGTPTQSQTPAVSREDTMADEGEDSPVKAEQSVFGQASQKTQTSLLGQSSQQPSEKPTSLFGQTSHTSTEKPTSLFGQPSQKPQSSVFGQSADKPQQSLFGQPSQKPAAPSPLSSFKLGTTFQRDDSAKDDEPASTKAGGSLFGSAFGNTLGEAVNESPKIPVTPIKKEPGLEEPKLEDISTTPASPQKSVIASVEAVQKPAEAPNSDTEEAVEEDAPLPPDFASFKPKPVEEDLPPIAGSPPVDLGEESTEELSPPASSLGEGEIDEEEEADDEDVEGEDGEEEEEEDDGSERDDDESWEDESGAEAEIKQESTETLVKPDGKASTGFGSRLTFPDQKSTSSSQAKSPVSSTTPAGLPKAPFFAPPTKTHESPRSPSPVRPTTSAAGRSQSRQASAQTIAVPPLGAHRRSNSRPSSAAQSQRPPQPPPLPEAGDLSDDEDQRIRDMLESEVEPTRNLDAFIAHQDYAGQVSKPGIGGQIEKVFRDINSMIDTLGMNARSLQAFVKGHEDLYKEAGRERSDLEDADDWCLIETDELGVVEKNLGDDLENGKVDGVTEKLAEMGDLYKEASRLRGKTSEMRKQIASRADPQQRASARAAPLSAEAQTQQVELRQSVAKVQKLLQEAEEALSVLRADLASVPANTNGASVQRTPTVEAVTNTILKMTAMIEQKSGDVDVLEAQIRRLPRGLADLSLEDETDVLRSSTRTINGGGRSSSPYGTPPSSRGRTAANGTPLGLSGMLGGRFRTPQHTSRMSMSMSISKSQSTYGLTYSPEDGEFGRSSLNGSARKKMTDVTFEEIEKYTTKVEQRRKVLGALKETIMKRETRITRVQK